MLTCYGSMAALALLPLAGASIALSDAAVAGSVALFAALAALAVGAGMRIHGARAPLGVALAGTALVLYAMFVDYSALVELAGFVLLAAGVAWDFRLRRKVSIVVNSYQEAV